MIHWCFHLLKKSMCLPRISPKGQEVGSAHGIWVSEEFDLGVEGGRRSLQKMQWRMGAIETKRGSL